jgi:hypothetical protein
MLPRHIPGFAGAVNDRALRRVTTSGWAGYAADLRWHRPGALYLAEEPLRVLDERPICSAVPCAKKEMFSDWNA